MAIDVSKRSRPQQCTAIIESKEQLTKNVYLVNFKLQNPPNISFLAGQTISLHVGEGLNRSMSIASVPADHAHILMVHDISPMGPGSKWTLAHNVGDTGTFMAPLGIFLLDRSPRKKVFVATGTGIAPFRSMLLAGIDAPCTVYWGLRYEEDIYWREEFEQLARIYPKFTFNLILSKPTDRWGGLRGHVTEHVLAQETNMQESEFYLCGNKEMVRDVDTKLIERGVPKAQIYKELYF